MTITLLLRRLVSSEAPRLATFTKRLQHRDFSHLDHETFASVCGSDPQDIARVHAFAKRHNLEVAATNVAARMVTLQGAESSIEDAFGVALRSVDEHWYGTYQDYSGKLAIPAELDGIVLAVLGLRNKPVVWRSAKSREVSSQDSDTTLVSPIDVAQAYRFPKDLDGSGQCIALIELPGGYRAEDIAAALKAYGIERPPSVELAFGENLPGQAVFDDIEVTMDIEIAAALAPGANIAVYFAKGNDAQSLYEAIASAIHDHERRPSVVSISLSGPEPLVHRPSGADVLFDSWKEDEIRLMNELFLEAAALGTTVCCASGDNGSQYPHGMRPFTSFPVANFPASSPNVLSCGGTTLQLKDGRIASETVWNSLAEILWLTLGDGPPQAASAGASSGGVSTCNALPDYQNGANVPVAAMMKWDNGNLDPRQTFAGRGVPDVAANADVGTGYRIRYAGRWIAGGGTSAAAPLWAGLVALLNQGLGRRIGFLNADIYRQQLEERRGITNDIANGGNGAYQARAGWDPCTGLGSPDGTALLDALRDAS